MYLSPLRLLHLIAGILLCARAVFAQNSPADQKPNIVVFLADDLSRADCSIYGGREIQTPNMERLSRAGMTMDQAFVVSPSCAPSRAALLTGLYPLHNGSMLNHQPPRAEVTKWPEYFRQLGYETVAIGKVAHYAQVRSYGFDYAAFFNYHQDECIEQARRWLEERNTHTDERKPLCLLVGTNWPHVPWPAQAGYDPANLTLPPNLVDTPEMRAAIARYAAAVANADRDLGLIYDAARTALGENTLFVFTSDHGAQFPFGKWNCTDTALCTPLVAAWPGRIEPGSRSDAMVTWIDLLPTMIEAAGALPPADKIDGRSFLPVLRGQRSDHRDRVFATHSGDGKMNRYPLRSVRTREWRYVRNLDPEGEFHSHIDQVDDEHYWASWVEKARTDPAAAALVARYFRRPSEELYDVQADPLELHNLAADPAQAKTVAALHAELDAWLDSQGDEGMTTERALPDIIPGGAGSKTPAKGTN